MGAVAFLPSAAASEVGTFVDAWLGCSDRHLQISPRPDDGDLAVIVLVAVVAFACVARCYIPCSHAWDSRRRESDAALAGRALLVRNHPELWYQLEIRPAFDLVSSTD